MKIERRKTYRIKGDSKYFKDKYGTSNPEILIECTDHEAWGDTWAIQTGNPACMLFAKRLGEEGISPTGKVWYGKVKRGQTGLGEVVCEHELEDIEKGTQQLRESL